MNRFHQKLKQILTLVIISLFCISCSNVVSVSNNPWELIEIPTEATFADIAFTNNPNHGWLVGTKASLFETTDGGETWTTKTIDFGEEKVSFTAVSFHQDEGWISGEPNVLLHTNNGGETWERIPLSEQLPGVPYGIIALDEQTAEMVTNLGAIYKTTNGGKSWKALVEGSVGVARNISRSNTGKYVAVSARGNFYSTWNPGDTEWTPHNRNSSRRLQNMGFTEDEHLWLIARGGQIQFTKSEDFEDWDEVLYPEVSTSWGFLDLATRTTQELWVAGGSANLLLSPDLGTTWQKDREVENVPSNFYNLVFLNEDQGFILGARGILLKYNPQNEQSA